MNTGSGDFLSPKVSVAKISETKLEISFCAYHELCMEFFRISCRWGAVRRPRTLRQPFWSSARTPCRHLKRVYIIFFLLKLMGVCANKFMHARMHSSKLAFLAMLCCGQLHVFVQERRHGSKATHSFQYLQKQIQTHIYKKSTHPHPHIHTSTHPHIHTSIHP